MLFQVYLIRFECKLTKLVNILRLVNAMPQRARRTMVNVQCSKAEILLMTTSPVTFDFEIDLWRVYAKNDNTREFEDVVLAHTHEFRRNLVT